MKLIRSPNLERGEVFGTLHVPCPYGQKNTSAIEKSSVFIAKPEFHKPGLMTPWLQKVHQIVDRF